MFEEISNNEEQNKLNAALFFNIIIGYIALMSTGIQPSDAQQIFIRNINRVFDSF
ncbi:hypothetical protein WKK_03475 [Weissella koreensis KACC 15510]|uniref:hypothetical protein n=1 Tax=Weissella koreensis TaxID=165096 RepID=UPI0002175A4B|nr:hypothetical protein [Weissella koreensis]AEJ23569.1 hypothetical protein WKK_03475 [Weissella koreensis KACC 15510]